MRTRSYIINCLLVICVSIHHGFIAIQYNGRISRLCAFGLCTFACFLLLVVVRFLSHFILDMSNSKQPSIPKGLDVIVCHNPFCSRGQEAFATEAALQKH